MPGGLSRTGSFHTGLDRGARQRDNKSRFLQLLQTGQEQLLQALDEYEDEDGAWCCGTTVDGGQGPADEWEHAATHFPGEASHRAHGYGPHLAPAGVEGAPADCPTTAAWTQGRPHGQSATETDCGDDQRSAARRAGRSGSPGAAVRMSSQSLPNSPQWTPLRPGTAASPKAVQPPRMGHGRPGDTSHPRSLEDIPRLERPHEMRKRAADADDSSLDLLAVHQCFKRFALSSRDEPSTPHPHHASALGHALAQAQAHTATLPVGPLPEHMIL